MKHEATHHEAPSGAHTVETATDRSFGLVFATVSLLLALYLRWHSSAWWLVALLAAPAFLGVALTRPSLLAPLNRVWTRFGLLLGAIVAPIVMGVIYYALITPMGLVARLLGKDFLSLKRDPAASSYWRSRQDGSPSPERLRDQF